MVVARCCHWGKWRLTPPSSGQPTAGFAICWSPLMSNVRGLTFANMRVTAIASITVLSAFFAIPAIAKAEGLDESLAQSSKAFESFMNRRDFTSVAASTNRNVVAALGQFVLQLLEDLTGGLPAFLVAVDRQPA